MPRMSFSHRILSICCTSALLLCAPLADALAQDGESAGSVSQKDIDKMLQIIEEQNKRLDEQSQTIGDLQDQLEELQDATQNAAQPAKAEPSKEELELQQRIDEQTRAIGVLQKQIDDLAADAPRKAEVSEEELKLRERLESMEKKVAAVEQDPAVQQNLEEFPGSIPIPRTQAAMRIGGFVKFNYVKSFDPIGSTDRFIVGSIPVNEEFSRVGSDTSLTANQSRFNIDLREKSSFGQFRAFIEGDFAETGDTFRLRHAYGQFRDVLTGKAWSTFYDAQAAPEEVDFEGINGQSILRQAQIKYFPQLGEDWDLTVSLEDPITEATSVCYPVLDAGGIPDPATTCTAGDDTLAIGGSALATSSSDIPDLVLAVKRKWFGLWHARVAAIGRRLSAQNAITSTDPASTIKQEDEATGWGLAMSGIFKIPFWNEADNLKFQLMYGEGLGHYINDTNTVEGLDAIFSPDGSLKALPVWAGYLAYQHFWRPKMRSTALVSVVDIDNFSFQPGDSYNRTSRASINYLWSPINRVDVGAELIWGKRINKDDNEADALQIQISTEYRF
ncbi:MAG: DcaP family trimeric outer membrane transporter [Gammaproteobacteria bacterium]